MAAGHAAAAEAEWEGGGSGNLVDRHGGGSHGGDRTAAGRSLAGGATRSLAGTERAALCLLRQNGRLGPLWTLAAFSKGSACSTAEDAYSCEEDADLHCLVFGGLFELVSELSW